MKVYLDNASTTYPKPEVLDEMYRSIGIYANASSNHSMGQKAKNVLETARERVAKMINANEDEIYFTSGGSESDSWAIVGTAFANKSRGNHIITSKIEHKAVLNACKYLSEQHGFEITYIDVDEYGVVKLEDIISSIKSSTILISIMYVNNEIGSIQPISQIVKLARSNNIIFHTDAVQAIYNLDVDVKEIDMDLMSISGHKIYASKGVGVLYIKKGTNIHNIIHGGAQERKKRAGTENIIGIAGMGKAAELVFNHRKVNHEYIKELKEYFISKIKEVLEDVIVLGNNTADNIVGICIKNMNTQLLLIHLDNCKITVSGGSACNSGSLEPSYVLEAMKISDDYKNGFLRFSFSDYNKKEELDYTINKIREIVSKLS